MDLLNDVAYEDLLRLSSSGRVAYGAASPSCSEYSRIKLQNDGGPPALRTPEHLQGRPGLSAVELRRVQESYLMLVRCVSCLLLVFQSGGHCHLEQPANAMSWLESEVRQFLTSISATCVLIPACAYGLDIYKTWMFACSWPSLGHLGGSCSHPPNSHQRIQGKTDAWGNYLSRATACYPPPLATAFATAIGPLLSPGCLDISWTNRFEILPVKSCSDFPFSQEDGGGLPSTPDWSCADRTHLDVFAALRTTWTRLIVSQRLDKVLLSHIGSNNPDPPFSDEELLPFKTALEEFLRQHGLQADWSIREHQPMFLAILQSLHHIMRDPDVTLFPSLLEGVRTGVSGNIPASSVFPRNTAEPAIELPLSVHLTNWQSAEEDPALTESLVAEELEKGWVFKYSGTLEQAQQEFPNGVSVGKLGIAKSDSRPPRLVVDSSICGLNSRCKIPERSTLPTAKEVLRSYPLRQSSRPLAGFSLDIKSAHKRVVLHPEERGLVGFSLNQDIYFYYVTPFGATFSAAWWSRVGGWILRCLHHLIWWSHCGFLYVDDFLFFMDAQAMPLAAALCCIFCQITRIPVSWRKSELGSVVTWIGWQFNFRAGVITLPRPKLEKIKSYLAELRRSRKTTRKLLEKTIGLLMWITQIFPLMRIWIQYLYQDLYLIPATHYSMDPGDWPKLAEHLSDSLEFVSRPLHSAVPLGSTLIAVRHTTLQSKDDLQKVRISPDKRLWLRIKDPASSRRTVREDSYRILKLFDDWLAHLVPCRSMAPKPYWNGSAAADACAAGDYCQLGGFIQHESGHCLWFSEKFTHQDFSRLPFQLEADMQKSIASFETLAQIGLVILVAAFHPGARLPVCLKSLSDNTGAEAVSNKCFTTTKPLCFFVEVLTKFASQTCIELDVGHIPGQANIIADDLSRWNLESDIPHGFLQKDRIRFTVADLWRPESHCSLVPSDASLLWSLP